MNLNLHDRDSNRSKVANHITELFKWANFMQSMFANACVVVVLCALELQNCIRALD